MLVNTGRGLIQIFCFVVSALPTSKGCVFSGLTWSSMTYSTFTIISFITPGPSKVNDASVSASSTGFSKDMVTLISSPALGEEFDTCQKQCHVTFSGL